MLSLSLSLSPTVRVCVATAFRRGTLTTTPSLPASCPPHAPPPTLWPRRHRSPRRPCPWCRRGARGRGWTAPDPRSACPTGGWCVPARCPRGPAGRRCSGPSSRMTPRGQGSSPARVTKQANIPCLFVLCFSVYFLIHSLPSISLSFSLSLCLPLSLLPPLPRFVPAPLL